MADSKRFNQIDVLYTIGTLLVVLGHSHYSDWSLISGTPAEIITSFIYSFHMPLFFFIAGFLFMNSNKIERIGYGKWISEKAIKLLTPYFVLSLIAIVPKYYIENHSFTGFYAYVIKAIFVPRIGVWGHFWFLPVIFFVYALFGIWKKYACHKNEKAVLSLTAIITIAIYFVPYTTDWLGIEDIKKEIVFFVIGMIFYFVTQHSRIVITKAPYLAMFIALSLASVLLYHYLKNSSVCMLLIAIMMIFACWSLSCVVGATKPTEWISQHNFTIYIYSWIFQSVTMAACQRIGMPWYMASIAMLITGILAPVVIILVYENWTKINNKFFDLLLGMK